MRVLFFLLTVVLLAFCVSTLNATTIHVPSDQPTIQAGINAAVDGDTVLVADGTYTGDGNRDIDFYGKAIVVMSESGSENCIIDCGGEPVEHHRGFYFHSGENSNSVIRGFTITNGYTSADGAGICCSTSSPLIHDNIIIGNVTEDDGGGIYCVSSSPHIDGNVITQNTSISGGGGIRCRDNSQPVIEGNTIVYNTAGFGGGGIQCDNSSPIIVDNEITGNSAIAGAGIHCENSSSPEIDGNTIANNIAEERGGGVALYNSPFLTIDDTAISDNVVENGFGGGIYSEFVDSLIVSNCSIVRNTASWSGGGISSVGRVSTITGCSIAYNQASGQGGGIECNNITSKIDDCMILFNTAPIGGGLYIRPEWDGTCYSTMKNCVIRGNTATGSGGGCYLGWTYAYNDVYHSLISCDISGNSASRGGGICCIENETTINGCSFESNHASEEGGGMYFYNSYYTPSIIFTTVSQNTSPTAAGLSYSGWDPLWIANSIFWDNSTEEIYIAHGFDTLFVFYSDVQGGWPGQGNIDEDPLFVLPDKSDFRLLWNSPCIDSGQPGVYDDDGTRCDMGAHFFDQDDYLTLYVTPDTVEVSAGEQLGVTYTVINRWAQQKSFWSKTWVVLPNGYVWNVLNPALYAIPAQYTARVHITHNIPAFVRPGAFTYASGIGMMPSTIYDLDSFSFWVVE